MSNEIVIPTRKELSDKIYKEMTLDNTSGVGKAHTDTFAAFLPEGLTMPIAEALSDYSCVHNAAGLDAWGRVVMDGMTQNPELEKASIEMAAGPRGAKLHMTVERDHQYPNPQDRDHPVIKHGVVTATYTTPAGTKGEEWVAASNELKNAFMAAFGSSK